MLCKPNAKHLQKHKKKFLKKTTCSFQLNKLRQLQFSMLHSALPIASSLCCYRYPGSAPNAPKTTNHRVNTNQPTLKQIDEIRPRFGDFSASPIKKNIQRSLSPKIKNKFSDFFAQNFLKMPHEVRGSTKCLHQNVAWYE